MIKYIKYLFIYTSVIYYRTNNIILSNIWIEWSLNIYISNIRAF